MLTDKEILKKIEEADFSVFRSIGISKLILKASQVLLLGCFAFFGALFLPWTQNIDGYGVVNTIKATERPQQINAAIDGQIKKWFVSEGDVVKKGDTLVKITEIKDYYLDTLLIARTTKLVELKKESIVSYESKVKALTQLVETLEQNKLIKLNQTKNKLSSYLLKFKNDSANYVAAEKGFEVAELQYKRATDMKDKGMIPQYELENRTVKFQQAKAKLMQSANKKETALYDIDIAKNEVQNIVNSYNEKIAKATSELNSGEIAMITAKNDLVKQENQLANLTARSGMYYLTAPQNGFISSTNSSGIGEIVKKGQTIINIVPSEQKLAAEIFVKPIDVPLLVPGEEVRLVFDGWPSIVFSGWQGASVGTFSAEIYSIDQNISKKGKYRVLVTQDENQPWPKLLKVGSGVHAYVLLNDVPIWFELWRQLNGFPANFYEKTTDESSKKSY